MSDESKKTDGEAASAAMAGTVEAAEPTRAERARALVADFEHAHRNNGPMTLGMIAELKVLLDTPPDGG